MSLKQHAKFIWIFWGLSLALLVVWLLGVTGVLADVGAVPIVPPGSGIQTLTDTPVQMQSELVRLDVRLAKEADLELFVVEPENIPYAMEWLPAVADVSAEFVMFNPSADDVTLTAWFPLAAGLEDTGFQGRISPIEVEVAGEALPVSVVELPNPVAENLPAIPWASFPITFPAGEELVISVSYVLPPQLTPGDSIGMRFAYIFQSGASWAGPIGKAELVVSLPFEATAETVGEMPPGGEIDGDTLRWTWLELEPTAEDDFSLRTLQPTRWQEIKAKRLPLQTNPQNGQNWLALGKAYRLVVYSKGPLLDKNFGAYYQPLAVAAFQKASELLPENAEAHVGLADMYLAAIYRSTQANLDGLQKVLDELALAEQLESQRPPEAGELRADHVRFYLEAYRYNLAQAATREAQTQTAARSTQLAETLTAELTASPTATSQLPTLTPQPIVTSALSPTPAPAGDRPAPALLGGILLIAGSLGLLVALVLWRRSQR